MIEDEVKFLRKKVNQLEDLILSINTKLGLVLDKFLNHRAKQVREEETVCLSLISQLKTRSVGVRVATHIGKTKAAGTGTVVKNTGLAVGGGGGKSNESNRRLRPGSVLSRKPNISAHRSSSSKSLPNAKEAAAGKDKHQLRPRTRIPQAKDKTANAEEHAESDLEFDPMEAADHDDDSSITGAAQGDLVLAGDEEYQYDKLERDNSDNSAIEEGDYDENISVKVEQFAEAVEVETSHEDMEVEVNCSDSDGEEAQAEGDDDPSWADSGSEIETGSASGRINKAVHRNPAVYAYPLRLSTNYKITHTFHNESAAHAHMQAQGIWSHYRTLVAPRRKRYYRCKANRQGCNHYAYYIVFNEDEGGKVHLYENEAPHQHGKQFVVRTKITDDMKDQIHQLFARGITKPIEIIDEMRKQHGEEAAVPPRKQLAYYLKTLRLKTYGDLSFMRLKAVGGVKGKRIRIRSSRKKQQPAKKKESPVDGEG